MLSLVRYLVTMPCLTVATMVGEVSNANTIIGGYIFHMPPAWLQPVISHRGSLLARSEFVSRKMVARNGRGRIALPQDTPSRAIRLDCVQKRVVESVSAPNRSTTKGQNGGGAGHSQAGNLQSVSKKLMLLHPGVFAHASRQPSSVRVWSAAAPKYAAPSSGGHPVANPHVMR